MTRRRSKDSYLLAEQKKAVSHTLMISFLWELLFTGQVTHVHQMRQLSSRVGCRSLLNKFVTLFAIELYHEEIFDDSLLLSMSCLWRCWVVSVAGYTLLWHDPNLSFLWQVDTRVTACPWWWTSWREYSAGRCLDPTSGSGRALHAWQIWYAVKSKTVFTYLYTPCSTETSKNSFAKKNLLS